MIVDRTPGNNRRWIRWKSRTWGLGRDIHVVISVLSFKPSPDAGSPPLRAPKTWRSSRFQNTGRTNAPGAIPYGLISLEILIHRSCLLPNYSLQYGGLIRTTRAPASGRPASGQIICFFYRISPHWVKERFLVTLPLFTKCDVIVRVLWLWTWDKFSQFASWTCFRLCRLWLQRKAISVTRFDKRKVSPHLQRS